MAEVIQFPCPVCGTTLRLPLSLAASQGACPHCQREIVAPDPASGLGAYEYKPPPPSRLIDPPFRTSRSAPVTEIPVTEKPAETSNARPAPVIEARCSGSPQRAILVLSVLLTAVLALLAGFIVGTRSNWLISQIQPPRIITPKIEKFEPPVEPPTKTLVVTPKTPEPVKPAEPIKASAAAEAALKAFLDAPDWSTRSAHVLQPEKIREAMEKYSHEAPDGPTPFKSISLQNSHTDKDSGNTLFVFQVVTETHAEGIPVAVAETTSGWQVDWQTFIEFRDDLFKSFADGPAEKTGKFHLIVSSPPAARAEKTANEYFVSFLLDPPLPDRQQLAYVRKSSEIQSILTPATASGAVFTPVLEVAKRNTPDGKPYLEIIAIHSSDWLPDNR